MLGSSGSTNRPLILNYLIRSPNGRIHPKIEYIIISICLMILLRIIIIIIIIMMMMMMMMMMMTNYLGLLSLKFVILDQ